MRMVFYAGARRRPGRPGRDAANPLILRNLRSGHGRRHL